MQKRYIITLLLAGTIGAIFLFDQAQQGFPAFHYSSVSHDGIALPSGEFLWWAGMLVAGSIVVAACIYSGKRKGWVMLSLIILLGVIVWLQSSSIQGGVCPGVPPQATHKLGTAWEALNPNGECDLTYAVTRGAVEFDGNEGGYTVDSTDKVVGRKDTKILIRARATSGDAELYYMLCPLSKGPLDGGWQCRQ